jgi:chitodextrinase
VRPATRSSILPVFYFSLFLSLSLILAITGCGSGSYTSPPPPDTVPPSAPTSLLVTAVSSSQLNLSWTASTDNVAVSGYKVERCQGSACSNFTQVAAPTGTTYNDTGLAGSTSYSYRVRATDAAGNLSSYSGAGSATTAVAAIIVQVTPVRGGATLSQSLTFTANLQNDVSSAGVTWTSSGGTFSSHSITTATFVAPSATTGNVTVTATSVADSTQSATATIAVTDLSGVYTYQNDNSRTGSNLHEFALTTSNVNSATFGKLFSCNVDATVTAQPLWVANQSFSGVTHNAIYVATEKNSVYAFDADSSACQILWQKSLNPAGETSVLASDVMGCGNVVPDLGIIGTPVIDPATGTLYVVSRTTNAPHVIFHQRLHALDLLTGNEKFSGPTEVQATVAGTGGGSSGGSLSFDPLWNAQRPALLLETVSGATHVIVSWASNCDFGQYHGWVISYNAGTLAREAVFNGSPNGVLGGIWMSGSGPAADANGNIYFVTGNGTFDANSGGSSYGDSIVKLGPPSGGVFPILSYFAPLDESTLEAGDADLGSGGLLLLPDLSSGAPTQLLVQAGKDGRIFLADRNSLGGFSSTSNNVVQQLSGQISNGMWGSPAYWHGNLYFGPSQFGTSPNNPLRVFSFNTPANPGRISASATSQSANVFGYPGPTPSVSSSGSSNGIVWALNNSASGSVCPTACQVVFAYDANDLGIMLYTSSQAPASRDRSGSAVKFAVPTVANGKVYVGGQTTITVYGLLPN